MVRRFASPQGERVHGTAGAALSEGMMVALLASGAAVPAGTALSGHAIGVACHDAANGAAIEIETNRVFCYRNEAADPVLDATALGTTLYISDEYTVTVEDDPGSTGTPTREAAGILYGIEPDGLIRVKVKIDG